jgi:hypothetical protein
VTFLLWRPSLKHATSTWDLKIPSRTLRDKMKHFKLPTPFSVWISSILLWEVEPRGKSGLSVSVSRAEQAVCSCWTPHSRKSRPLARLVLTLFLATDTEGAVRNRNRTMRVHSRYFEQVPQWDMLPSLVHIRRVKPNARIGCFRAYAVVRIT